MSFHLGWWWLWLLGLAANFWSVAGAAVAGHQLLPQNQHPWWHSLQVRPSPSMDPEPERLRTLTNIDLVAQWAELDGARDDETSPRGALFRLLGFHGAEHPRFVGIRPEADFQALLGAWRIPVPPTAAEPNPRPVAPTFAQLGQAGIFARTCRVIVGTEPSNRPAPAMPPPVPAAPTVAAGRKIKMAQAINQTDEDEVEPMDQTAINAAYALYQLKTGGFPPEVKSCRRSSWQPWITSSKLVECPTQTWQCGAHIMYD